MATTTGSHSVAAFTSPVNGTSPIDANAVKANDNTLRVAYVNHDADTGIHVQSSTFALRPVAGVAGRKWITTDTGGYRLWFDTGVAWEEASSNSIIKTYVSNAVDLSAGTEVTLFTASVPSLAAGDIVETQITYAGLNNSGGLRTWEIKATLGAMTCSFTTTTLGSSSSRRQMSFLLRMSPVSTATAVASGVHTLSNPTNSGDSGNGGNANGFWQTSAVNITGTQTLTLIAKMSASGSNQEIGPVISTTRLFRAV